MGFYVFDYFVFILNDFLMLYWFLNIIYIFLSIFSGYFCICVNIMVIMMVKVCIMNIVFNKVFKIIMFREVFIGIINGILLFGGLLVFFV